MMGVREIQGLSPLALRNYVGSRSSRLLCNNTWVEDLGEGGLGIRLHNTRILVFHRDGSVTINSGGWQTVTTKQRLNALLPSRYRVFSKNHQWFIDTPRGTYPFVDGDRWPPPQLMLFKDAA